MELERYMPFIVTILTMAGGAIAWEWKRRQEERTTIARIRDDERAARRQAQQHEDERLTEPLERLITGMQRTIDDLRADFDRAEERWLGRERTLQTQVQELMVQHGDCLKRLAVNERETEILRNEVSALRRQLGHA